MTGVGEFILALLLLARRCNGSVENGDIPIFHSKEVTHHMQTDQKSIGHRTQVVSLEEVTNRYYKQPTIEGSIGR